MLWRIKYVLNKLDYLLSQAFLSVQSKFSNVVLEKIKYVRFSSTFPTITGHINLDSDDIAAVKALLDDPKKCRIRGGMSHKLTRVVDLKNFEKIEKAIKHQLDGYIKSHYGAKFNMHLAGVRNYHVPAEFENTEIYSNRWHQDSDFGIRQSKIFILLHSVNENDGPLTYLDRSNTKKEWRKLADRFSFESFAQLYEFEDEKKFVGNTGDYIVINTSICAHRASVPTKKRDMLVCTLTHQ